MTMQASRAILDAKGDRLMAWWEVLEEIDWQLSCGTHPLLIAQLMHRSPDSLDRLARRHGRVDLSVLFSRTYNRWTDTPD